MLIANNFRVWFGEKILEGEISVPIFSIKNIPR